MELFVPHTLFKPYSLVLIAISSALYMHAKFREKRRLNALGGNAAAVRSFLPFGLDVIARSVYAGIHNQDLENWENFFKPHGPECRTVETNMLGLRCVFTNDAENIKAVLASQFEEYGKGPQFHKDWEPFLGDSIFTTDGPQWRASRKLIRPQFLKERISDLSMFERHVQLLLKCSLQNGAHVELSNLFLRYTFDTSTEFLFGKSIGSLENPHDEFSKAFSEVQKIQGMLVSAGPANIFIPRSSYRASLRTIDAFVGPFIEEALASSVERKGEDGSDDDEYNFLHALADFTQDRKVLRDQLIAVLLAGRDTTAAALSWTFYELARHPRVVEKLRQEIGEVLGFDQQPTYQNLKDMKYLQAVLSETLRMYPSIPFNFRVALRDTSLPRGSGSAGDLPVGILKDTIIAYSALALQRTGIDALSFEPERWFEKPPTPWTYIPFNGGPRTCVGQQYALAEMGYTVTRILQCFERVEDLGIADPVGNLKSEIVLQPQNGVHVRFWLA